ncbi:hypothetical protein P0D75_38750 [Paraburkholderia sediminicola]|uniref:hypothetical protein n=1 Tax=Paraburkholderia sediminicola TaxID=458836 RepID=UPI0038BBBBF0
MSAFHGVMEYAREHLPGISADISYDHSKSLRSRQSVMDAVAELMRRINYVPDAASLSENRGHWAVSLTGNHMLDPKNAAQAYKRFVADMNDDMVNSLRHALECRVARERGEPEPPPPVRRGMDDDGWAAPPSGVPAQKKPVVDEALDAVVSRLLEVPPLDDEKWGAW